MANSARLRKTVVATFYVYIVFLVCYLPLFCVRAVTATRGESALGLHLLYYAATIMYLNSSLNPLIYCWKMRHIRQVVVQILRGVFVCQKIFELKIAACGALPNTALTFGTCAKISCKFLHKPSELLLEIRKSIKKKCSGKETLITGESNKALLKRRRVLHGTADGFLATRFNLRYQELVTHKRFVFVVTSAWELCTMTEAEGLNTPTLVANCVLNGFLSYTAIVLNIITIQALRKTSSLPKTLKTLLLSLSISDLGVGLLVQPLYVAFLTMEITENSKNTDNIIAYWAVVKAYVISDSLFAFASFFGVFAITVDRFLAIHLHLRYQELVTHKRVVAAVISFWVFSVIACFGYEKSIIVLSVMSVVCIITTGLLYCKIYAAVRHHTNQIRLLQVPEQEAQNGDMANATRFRKTAVATFYV
ncbi:unnamed protein product [Porites evermanni]|uniref:G-protein coupled receptors family 1 profile domain-containing protein n=1 Tax=Porites evermanni TaxID=104178 RepID=A0ABN8M6X0_9CNID|nr:unnamed protein product [Porites evermanni]